MNDFIASRPLNTLLFLTLKRRVASVIKVVSAEFKDRLQIGVVNVREAEPEIVEEL